MSVVVIFENLDLLEFDEQTQFHLVNLILTLNQLLMLSFDQLHLSCQLSIQISIILFLKRQISLKQLYFLPILFHSGDHAHVIQGTGWHHTLILCLVSVNWVLWGVSGDRLLHHLLGLWDDSIDIDRVLSVEVLAHTWLVLLQVHSYLIFVASLLLFIFLRTNMALKRCLHFGCATLFFRWTFPWPT